MTDTIGAGLLLPPPLTVSDRKLGSLHVRDGELVVLLGPSGAGKTTWLRRLVGLGGRGFDSVYLFGRKQTKEVIAASIGWVPQGDGVFLSESVLSNVMVPRLGRGCSGASARDALDMVGLADRALDPVQHLGIGARRRVALARALARRVPLIVIDGALDATLWALFLALRSNLDWVRGWLVADCVAGEMAWRAESVALVGYGRVIAQAPLAGLIDSPDPDVISVIDEVTP